LTGSPFGESGLGPLVDLRMQRPRLLPRQVEAAHDARQAGVDMTKALPSAVQGILETACYAP
jgi:hypothetical protein